MSNEIREVKQDFIDEIARHLTDMQLLLQRMMRLLERLYEAKRS